MNVDSGRITEVPKGKKIDERSVFCPNSKSSQNVMTGWGSKKRQRYAHLVKVDGYDTHEAFNIVEFNKGKV